MNLFTDGAVLPRRAHTGSIKGSTNEGGLSVETLNGLDLMRLRGRKLRGRIGGLEFCEIGAITLKELLTALFMPVPGRGGGHYLAKYPLAVKYLLAVPHSLHTRPRTGGVRYVAKVHLAVSHCAHQLA